MPRRRPALDARRAVAYIRVSTDDQAHGPEAQRAAILRWASAAGVEVVAWAEDLGVSGAAPLDRRPGLCAALEALTVEGAGVLVVARRDRLARDVAAAAMIDALCARAGARVSSAAGEGEGDDPAALLMRRMVDAFAEYERALIRARTRGALAGMRARGLRTGECPLGAAPGPEGRLVVDADEARAVELLTQLRRDGLSIRAIAAELDARGIPARGGRWHPTTVARVLRRGAA